MNCAIIGYGSIGQRHERILKELGCRVVIVSKRDLKLPVAYNSLAAALEKEEPDYIVISNGTSEHFDSLARLADCGFKGTVLVEKPLFDIFKAIPVNNFKKAYVAYNLRFHPILEKIKEITKKERALYAQVYTGQYLPGWRPERDYRMSYSARRIEGGGVLLDLSHELDYLQWLFGSWSAMTAMGGKYSSLETDSDDIYSLMLIMDKCPVVQVHLNYLDRISRREITVITENYTVKAELVQQTLQINDRLIHYKVDRDYTYYMQHKAIMNGTGDSLCSLKEGLKVLEMVGAAELSSKQRRWVKN